MREANIEDIAYQLKRNKDTSLPGAIVFLGAGASVTAGIPSADKIAKTILEKYGDAPAIQRLTLEEKTYHVLMGCLTPNDRKILLNEYIKIAKINVTHIYLAHLMVSGYVDYIVTVNFDNLILRALALFNQFPATYDISILKEITTTSFDKPAVIFMHGQHHGLWQLNTNDEMAKIGQTVPHIFRSIANQRPWIVVGYGANDPVFKYLVELGRFDNNLYWVGYKENEPAKHIKESLLDKPNSDASWVKGYDSDLFFLKLHAELKLDQPDIFSKPFSHIKKLHASIIDIQDDDNFKVVQERLRITGQQIDSSIAEYEVGISEKTEEESKKIDVLRLEIIDKYLKNDFGSLPELEKKIFEDEESDSYLYLLSAFYYKWGNTQYNLANTKTGEEAEQLFRESFAQFRKATDLNPDYASAYNNWGAALSHLAKTKTGEEAEQLNRESFERYRKATDLNPDYANAYNNWGTALSYFAKTKAGEEAERLNRESFERFRKATDLDPDYASAYNNWGAALVDLANTKTGEVSEQLYRESFERYRKATELNPGYTDAYDNWGNALFNLAQMKTGQESEQFYRESFERYRKATDLNPDYASVYNNWGTALCNLAKIKTGEESEQLYGKSFEQYKKATDLNPDNANVYNNWGTALSDLASTKTGEEAEQLYSESFERFRKATDLNPDDASIYNNWGAALAGFSKGQNQIQKKHLIEQSILTLKKAYQLNPDSATYNLACAYALNDQKEEALHCLEITLKSKKVSYAKILADTDWVSLEKDDDFLALIKKYK